ncbi:unnamed protein product [Scytosiphon promiscuus]
MWPLNSSPAYSPRRMGCLIACLVLMLTTRLTSVTAKTCRDTRQTRSAPLRSPARTRAWQSAWTLRGGYERNSATSSSDRGHDGQTGGDGVEQDSNPIDRMTADLLAKRDNIAADIHAKGEAIAADFKSKQEKITDEMLRERSPEAFGELGGHSSSYDAATAGMDVASRRSFFLGVRRVILLVQVVEFLAASLWQAAFPYGGVAGFVAAAPATAGGTDGTAAAIRISLKEIVAGGVGDGTGRLGLAIAACLAQFSVYTMLLVWFGCDRVVLRGIRVTGWEHGAAAAWALARLAVGPGDRLSHLAASTWLGGMAVLCAYFGRQL